MSDDSISTGTGLQALSVSVSVSVSLCLRLSVRFSWSVEQQGLAVIYLIGPIGPNATIGTGVGLHEDVPAD